MISRIFLGRSHMNDKGHYHSYYMDADSSEDPRARRTATALQVERFGEGWLPALLAPKPGVECCVMEFFTAHIRNPNTRKQSVAVD